MTFGCQSLEGLGLLLLGVASQVQAEHLSTASVTVRPSCDLAVGHVASLAGPFPSRCAVEHATATLEGVLEHALVAGNEEV